MSPEVKFSNAQLGSREGSNSERGTNVENTFLPPELPELIFGVPTGRLHLIGQFVRDIIEKYKLEIPTISMMIMIGDNGNTPHRGLSETIQLNPEINTEEFPIYMMTGATKEEAFEAIFDKLPDHIKHNQELVNIAKFLLTAPGYGPQRVRLEIYQSVLGLNGMLHKGGPIHISLDDDLGFNRQGLPMLKPESITEHGLPSDVNYAAYVPREQLNDGVINYHEGHPLFSPYTEVLGRTLKEVPHVEAYYEGFNNQNPALEATLGKRHVAFREHHHPKTTKITDPNACFILAFGGKWGNPDVEAYSKLYADVQSGQEIPELSMQAVLTGKPTTIGIQTHPVNMDTAHQARNFAEVATNLLPYLITDPKISDEFGTMSYIVGGVSHTNGVRAEMCLLIGENGLLKQISDTFQKTFLAAQVSSRFEHKRLGGKNGLRSPEAVAAFSEFLGMELASIVRNNIIIDTNDLTMSLKELPSDTQLITPDSVNQMYVKMIAITQEIDKTVRRLNLESGNPLAQEAIKGLSRTKVDIERRLQVEKGTEAFYYAVNEELRAQYEFMSKILQVHSHLLRAGADLRREGKFPIARIRQSNQSTNALF